MSLLHLTKSTIAVVSGAIVAIGAATGTLDYRLQRRRLTRDLLHDTAAVAAAFEREDVRALAGARSDVATPAYLAAKHRLQKLKRGNSRIRYLAIYRVNEAGGPAVFLVDSTPDAARDEPLPGEIEPNLARLPGLPSTLRSGQPSSDDPVRAGPTVTVNGYAPITGSNPPSAGADSNWILQLNATANNWAVELWVGAFRGAFYAWTLLGVPFVALLVTRRQGEQREAIRNLSEAVEQSHSAIVILDLEQRIEYVNRGVCHQIGYSRRELIGRHWLEFFAGQVADPAAADMMVTVKSGRTWEGEWVCRRQDGTMYPVHGILSPVKHRDGSMACFVATFDDVSEAKRKEAELREARDQAQAGDRAKGQFLATMSHEVRTPLNGIVGFTSLLLDTSLSGEQREYVQTIRASGEALIHLTGDILDFARIESGKLKLDPMACDPRECIEEAFDLHAAKAAEKNIDLLHHAADDVPAAVMVDGGRLRQVLVNLVGNAVKFTDHGTVAVDVELVAPEPGTKSDQPMEPHPSRPGATAARMASDAILKFSVRDTGIGISPEQHGRLFKPFSQVDETPTRRYGGAGLGLAICKNLVQLMGGSISLASVAGQGSTFTFTIRVPVVAPHPPIRNLDGMEVGLAIRGGPLRRELAELLTSWDAKVQEADAVAELANRTWDLAVVEVSDDYAKELASTGSTVPQLPPEKTIALVPIALSSEIRSALRSHFRLLINRPVHHGAFFAILSGSRPAGPDANTPATQFGFRVLIVEDNEVNQRLMQRVLTGMGCATQVVGNGRAAIEELAARAASYDVVLLDLHMPEMDGLSALERIRSGAAGPAAQALWFIALTADVRPEQRARGFATGLDDYLTKPLRMAELEAALRRFRNERAARQS